MRCTLINKPSAEICDACLTSRPEGIERLSGTYSGKWGEDCGFDAFFRTTEL